MRYSAIIFDLDGVLCHTDQSHYRAWKAMADTLDIYFDAEINNRLRGVSRADSLEIILERYEGPALSADKKEQLMAQKNVQYQALLQKMTPAENSAEVLQTLETLRANGHLLAIGSSSKNAPLILQRLDLLRLFDAVSDGNGLVHSKPHPEVFLKAAALLNVPPSECLVVEDAEAGLQAALAAGMHCAGIGEAAQSSLATYALAQFAQLTALV